MSEQCAICGCRIHSIVKTYAQPSIAGRSHASKHYYVAERFFGRAKNRREVQVEGILALCPWKREAQFAILCYECHAELLFHPVVLPEDVARFADLVKHRGLSEVVKTESRAPIAGRVALLQEVIALGIATALQRERLRARKRTLRELAPLLWSFAAIFLLVGFSPWVAAYSAAESIAVEGWLFFLAGLFVCSLSPARPFRAALLGSVGVFVGTAVGIIARVIVSNAVGINPPPQQAFDPIALAGRAGISVPSLLLSALIWKAALASFFWDMGRLRDLAQERIQAQRHRLLASLHLDIAALRSRRFTVGSQAIGGLEQEIVGICSNQLYAMAEVVLAQYDAVVTALLIPNLFALKALIRDVPNQLQPLFGECLVQVRREANRSGVPEVTAKCMSMLGSRYEAICEDVALTLRVSLAQHYRDQLREVQVLLFQRLPDLIRHAYRWALVGPMTELRVGLASYWRKPHSRREGRAPATAAD